MKPSQTFLKKTISKQESQLEKGSTIDIGSAVDIRIGESCESYPSLLEWKYSFSYNVFWVKINSNYNLKTKII